MPINPLERKFLIFCAIALITLAVLLFINKYFPSNIEKPVPTSEVLPKNISGQALINLKERTQSFGYKPIELIPTDSFNQLDEKGWSVIKKSYVWSPGGSDSHYKIPLDLSGANRDDSLLTSQLINIDYTDLAPENPPRILFSMEVDSKKTGKSYTVSGGDIIGHCPDVLENLALTPDVVDTSERSLNEKNYNYLLGRYIRFPFFSTGWVHRHVPSSDDPDKKVPSAAFTSLKKKLKGNDYFLIDDPVPTKEHHVFQRRFDRDIVFSGPVDLFFSNIPDLEAISVNLRVSLGGGFFPTRKEIKWEDQKLSTFVVSDGENKFIRLHLGSYLRREHPKIKKITLEEITIFVPQANVKAVPLEKIVFNKNPFTSYNVCSHEKNPINEALNLGDNWHLQAKTITLPATQNHKRLELNLFGMLGNIGGIGRIRNLNLTLSPSDKRFRSGIKLNRISIIPQDRKITRKQFLNKGEFLNKLFGGPFLIDHTHDIPNVVEWPHVISYLPWINNQTNTRIYQSGTSTSMGVKIHTGNGALYRTSESSDSLVYDFLVYSPDAAISIELPRIRNPSKEYPLSLVWQMGEALKFQKYTESNGKLLPTLGSSDKINTGDKLFYKLIKIDNQVLADEGGIRGRLVIKNIEKEKVPEAQSPRLLDATMEIPYNKGTESINGIQVHSSDGASHLVDKTTKHILACDILLESETSLFSLSFPMLGISSVDRMVKINWVKSGHFNFKIFLESEGKRLPVDNSTQAFFLRKGQTPTLKAVLSGEGHRLIENRDIEGRIAVTDIEVTDLKEGILLNREEALIRPDKAKFIFRLDIPGATLSSPEKIKQGEMSPEGLMITGKGNLLEIDWPTQASLTKDTRLYFGVPEGFKSILSLEVMAISKGEILSTTVGTLNDSFKLGGEPANIDSLRLRMKLSGRFYKIYMSGLALFEPTVMSPEQAFDTRSLLRESTPLIPENIITEPNSKTYQEPGFLKADIFLDTNSDSQLTWSTKVNQKTNWIKGLKVKFKVPPILAKNNPCWLQLTFASLEKSFQREICPDESTGEVFLPSPFYLNNGSMDSEPSLDYELDSIMWNIRMDPHKLQNETPLGLKFEMKLERMTYQSIANQLSYQLTSGWKDDKALIKRPDKISYKSLINNDLWMDFQLSEFSEKSISALNRVLGENIEVSTLVFSDKDLKITPFIRKNQKEVPQVSSRSSIWLTLFIALVFFLFMKLYYEDTLFSDKSLVGISIALHVAGFFWAEVFMLLGIVAFIIFWNRIIKNNRTKVETRWPMLARHVYRPPRNQYVFGFILASGVTIFLLLIGLNFMAEQIMNIGFFMYLLALILLVWEAYQQQQGKIQEVVK